MAGIKMPIIASAELGDFLKVEQRMQKMAAQVKRTSGSFSGLGRAITGAISGAALIGLGKSALQEASDAYKVNQLTNTILKNTGASAYITAQQISDLSGKLSIQAGIDDELVQAGANVILSFKNIRNVGTGAKAIFDRTTAASVDLAAAMKTDVTTAAKTLGRALANPANATRALRAANIQLTNSQKEQIAAMQARGDLIGAQQIILGEVENRFNGAAAAMATPMDRLNAAMQQILEQVGIPLLEAFIPLLDDMAPKFQNAAGGAYKFGLFIVDLFKKIWQMRGLIINVAKLLVAMWVYTKVAAGAQAVITIIMSVVKAIKALRAASLAAVIAEAAATGGTSLIAAGVGVAAATAAVAGMSFGIDKLTNSLDAMPDIKVPELPGGITSDIDATANSYRGLSDAIDAATESGRDFAAGAKKTTRATRAARPKTATARPTTGMGNQSFTVAGSGGGVSLSVTVNGSIMQERDVARTIRDELLQFGRRQGVALNLGV